MQQRRHGLPIESGDMVADHGRFVRHVFSGSGGCGSGGDSDVEDGRADERRRQGLLEASPPVDADGEGMLLAFFQAAGADQGRPRVGQHGILVRYSRPGARGGAEVEGVRFGGGEEEGRVRAGSCGIPGVVRYRFAELDVLRLRCELRWNFGRRKSPFWRRRTGGGPVVEAVHGQFGGGF